jgi:hypothetical protein
MEQPQPCEVTHETKPVLKVKTIDKIYRYALKGDYLECTLGDIIVRGFSLTLPSELEALKCKIPMLSLHKEGDLRSQYYSTSIVCCNLTSIMTSVF